MIRRYEAADLPALRALHRQFHPGELFPDPENEANRITLLDVREDGVIRGAVVMRLTVELIGIGNRSLGTPLDRYEVVNGLILAAGEYAHQAGIQEAHVAVRPAYRRYGVRLREMGLYPDEREWFTLDCHALHARAEAIAEAK